MSIYYEYLTCVDRELAIEESTFEVEFSRLYTMYEMTNLQLAQMHRDAELKVLTESGTYDDLTYLITEAEKEVAEQKKGIIARIVEAIGRFFSAIGNKIKQIFGKGDANMEVEAPVDVLEKGNALVTAINNADNGMAKLRNGDPSGALDILKAISIPTIAGIVVGAGVAAAKNKNNKEEGNTTATKKFKKGDLDNITKKVNDAFTRLKSNFESAKAKILNNNDTSKQDAEKDSLSIIQKISSAVNNFVGIIGNAVTKAMTTIKGANEEEKSAEGNGKEKKEPVDPRGGNQGMNMGARDAVVGFYNAQDGQRYRKLKDGTIELQSKVTNDKGKTKNKYKKVTNPSDELVNAKFENADDVIYDFCGADVVIERHEDYVIITETEEVVTESVKRSIFGYDLSNEEVFTESSDVFEQELKELSDLFDTL